MDRLVEPMRERIRARLREYRADALRSIGEAVNKTKSEFSEIGRSHSHGYYRSINENIEAGFTEYMDRSAVFICQVAPASSAEYADELRDAGHELKQEIMAKIDHDVAVSGNSIGAQLRNELEAALDKLIKHKVEDFEFGIIEGREMNATINNTVNVINSTISNAVVQITQSGKDTISKETALKLQELVNSEEIKRLPDDDRLEVLDRVSDLIEELQAPTTDKGKVHRGLIRLGKFMSSVASKTAAEIATKLAVAWAIGP
jgi:hypothetical protein